MKRKLVRSGFTMVEMLVALVVLAIVIVSVSTSLGGLQKASQEQNIRNAATELARSNLQAIIAGLRSDPPIVTLPPTINVGDPQPAYIDVNPSEIPEGYSNLDFQRRITAYNVPIYGGATSYKIVVDVKWGQGTQGGSVNLWTVVARRGF